MKLSYFPDHRSGFVDPVYRPSRALPTDHDHVIEEYTPISDQQNVSACVTNAICDALEIVLAHSRNDRENVPQLSRRWLYWTSRSYDGTTHLDEGTYVRTGLLQATMVGVCDENVCPYDTDKVFEPPSLEAVIRASENKIDGYFFIDTKREQRLRDIDTALHADHPVVFGTDVGRQFLDFHSTELLEPPLDREGGHAMVIVGVQHVAGKRQYLIRNSWGTRYRNGGRAWMSEDYLMWEKTRELAILTKMRELL